jgi:hypothetical protein
MGKKGMGRSGKTGKNALRRFIELTRPELAWTEQRRSERKDAGAQDPAAQHADRQAGETRRARGGQGPQRPGTETPGGRAPDDPESQEAGTPREGSRQERWRLIDISAMVLAVLQIILPITLILLAAVAGTYWLFILLFGG